MHSRCWILALALFVSTVALAAEDAYEGRIDLDGSTSDVEVVKVSADFAIRGGNGHWLPEAKRNCYMWQTFAATTEWQNRTIKFKASKDGTVSLCLMGAYALKDASKGKDLKELWTLFDDVEVTGAELKNGNFEAKTDWDLTPLKNQTPATFVSEGAHGGTGAMKVWHNGRAVQKLSVKAGVEVTVSFWFKAAK